MPHLPTPPSSTSSSRSPSQRRSSRTSPYSRTHHRSFSSSSTEDALAMATQQLHSSPLSHPRSPPTFYKPEQHPPQLTQLTYTSSAPYYTTTATYNPHVTAPGFPSPPSTASSSSYAGSEISENAPELLEVLMAKCAETFSPLALDRSIAIQAQTSGQLNATNRELAEVRREAANKLAGMRAMAREGLKTAKEVKRNLRDMGELATALSKKVEAKHPEQYRDARRRIDPEE